MTPAGRRPGPSGTRDAIVVAARAQFAEHGFNRASIRGIAQRAGVDPALVHHYFADKAALFVEALGLPGDPRRVAEEAVVPGIVVDGRLIVERFLAQWETDGVSGSPSFVSVVQAMAAAPQVADAVREFLAERLWIPSVRDKIHGERRRSLISSQLMGLGWTRYVMRLEPLASAPRLEVARWAGPTIDRYVTDADLAG